MALVQQGFRTGNGGGGGGLTEINIANTLYVMKNGNDATALPNRLDKPYLTIYEASLNAVAGDTIYVFSGAYLEGTNDIFASDVNYVLQDGVNVECDTKVVADFGNAKNINISGQGVLLTTSGGEGAVFMENQDSVLNLTCKNIIAEGDGIVCAGNFFINVGTIDVNLGTAILLSDTIGAGVKTFGTINFENILTTSNPNNVPISLTQCNTDSNVRDIFIYGNKITSSLNLGVGKNAVLQLENNFDSRIFVQIQNIIQSGSARLVDANNSKLFLNNSNGTNSTGEGINVQGNANVLITNCNLVSEIANLTSIDTANTQIVNTQLISNSGRAVFIDNNSELMINDSVLESGTGATFGTIYISKNVGETPILRIKNTQIIASDVAVGLSIYTSAPSNIYVQGQCSATLPTDANITNQVAGTNIIVDTDIVQNTTNFF